MIFYCRFGIERYPEIMEFCGDMQFRIGNELIECKKETSGSYINSYSVRCLTELKIKNASKVIFIENKANYIDYVQNRKKDDEFVIYHGGMYSPIKGEFFRKIYEAKPNIQFYHWSDIDMGGFKIFARLRKIIPKLTPYKMDVESFYRKKDYWIPMSSDYMKKLESLRNNREHEIFFELIDVMLKEKSKLEQESFMI